MYFLLEVGNLSLSNMYTPGLLFKTKLNFMSDGELYMGHIDRWNKVFGGLQAVSKHEGKRPDFC